MLLNAEGSKYGTYQFYTIIQARLKYVEHYKLERRLKMSAKVIRLVCNGDTHKHGGEKKQLV